MMTMIDVDAINDDGRDGRNQQRNESAGESRNTKKLLLNSIAILRTLDAAKNR